MTSYKNKKQESINYRMMNTETDQYCSILNFNSSFNWNFIPKTELLNNNGK